MGLVPKLKPVSLERIKNFQELFEKVKSETLIGIAGSKKSYEEFWIPRIGLLIMLDEAYGPLVKPFKLNIYSNHKAQVEQWNKWRQSVFNPRDILKNSNLTIENVKELYEGVATEGEWMDPLSKWFVLQRIIKESVKMKLKGTALYAQHCYQIAKMVYYFIYDLTGEKMYEPDDIMNGNGHGQWKSRVYGDPFDYTTKKTQKRILDIFLIDRPFRAGIVFEGDTEQVVIESILTALRVNKEKDGFFLYNARGQKNIIYNLKSLYDISKKEDIELFLILDNDERAACVKDELKNLINRQNIKIWKKDFEYDNFGIDTLVNNLNANLVTKGYRVVSTSDIKQLLKKSNKVLMNVVSNAVFRENGVKLDDILSKSELAKKLIAARVLEIEEERFEGNGWNPKLPIEKVLNEIFHKIPSISFS
jgi:hypothetical protein